MFQERNKIPSEMWWICSSSSRRRE